MGALNAQTLFGISDDVEDRLRLYDSLLHKWQEKINLVSPTTLPDSWRRHFIDSLQLLPLLPSSPCSFYDMGVGAGFSGMVLAIARPDIDVTLIESDSKKCAFLQTVSRETKTSVRIVNDRIERASQSLSAPDFVSARALAALPDLLKLSYPWIEQSPKLCALFPKGANFQQELDEAQRDGWLFHVKQTSSLTDPAAQILAFTGISRSK